MVFYRNLLAAAFELAPDQAMRAVADVVADFQMPGHGIENFARKSVQIAMAGIYDLRMHHDEVLSRCCASGTSSNVTGLDADGEEARERARRPPGRPGPAPRPASRRSATPEPPAWPSAKPHPRPTHPHLAHPCHWLIMKLWPLAIRVSRHITS